MTQNLSDEIRSKEKAAKDMVIQAKNQAAKLIANARTSSEQSIKEAKQQSHRALRDQIKTAESEAEAVSAQTVAAGRKEADAFYESKQPKVTEIADWLVKEVITTYGNSANEKGTANST